MISNLQGHYEGIVVGLNDLQASSRVKMMVWVVDLVCCGWATQTCCFWDVFEVLGCLGPPIVQVVG